MLCYAFYGTQTPSDTLLHNPIAIKKHAHISIWMPLSMINTKQASCHVQFDPRLWQELIKLTKTKDKI